MENTTRIVDLPENTNQTYFSGPLTNSVVGSVGGDNKTQYMPLNVHPNPYLDSNGGNGGNAGNGGMAGMTSGNANLQRLPSKDIRINNTDFVQDPQIQPNYIPVPPEHNQNYIPESMMYDNDYPAKKPPSKRTVRFADETNIDSIWNKYKIPIFLCLVFFIFQLPVFNRYMKEYIPLPYFYNENQLTTTGIFFKAVLFSAVYYVFMEYVIEYL